MAIRGVGESLFDLCGYFTLHKRSSKLECPLTSSVAIVG